MQNKKHPLEEILNEECIKSLEDYIEQLMGKDAQHLAQDVLSKSLEEALQDYKEGVGIEWIRGIIRHNCTDEHKKIQAERKAFDYAEPGELPQEEQSGTPSANSYLEDTVAQHSEYGWFLDEDGIPVFQRSIDYANDVELAKKISEYQNEGVDLIGEFLGEPKPGQGFHDGMEEDGTWAMYFMWGHHCQAVRIPPGILSPSDIDTLRNRFKGIPLPKDKTKGAERLAVHRVLKKILQAFSS
jgi:hypothetical protein